jgi:hypothetical protein
MELVDGADKNKDGKIDFNEFEYMGMAHGRFSCKWYSYSFSSRDQEKDSNGREPSHTGQTLCLDYTP